MSILYIIYITYNICVFQYMYMCSLKIPKARNITHFK